MTRSASLSGLLQTLDRGLRVLEAVAAQEGRATSQSLASELGINLGTCYQILRTLQVAGYIQRQRGGYYGLGSRVGFLLDHYQATASPPPELTDALAALHREIEETVYLSVKRGRRLEIVDIIEGTRALRVGNLSIGYSDHPHVRASAKALLAFSDERTVKEFFADYDLVRLTPNTITEWEALEDELKATRRRGYGIDNEEFSEGIACIGSVIVDRDGTSWAAFGTSFPSSRLESEREALAREVMLAAESASRALGYNDVYPPLVS